MDCVACGSAAVTERPERTAQGYRRFRCRDCGKQYNERSGGLLNHTQYPPPPQHPPQPTCSRQPRRLIHLRRTTSALAILEAA